ncbi:hypothetical protein HKW97_25030 (plasmid) [Pseudomonas luteola]|uniref:hypothetical protein n=1 Tax=Pseudomonas luteola TaxID=47886 RepID=UPI00388CED44
MEADRIYFEDNPWPEGHPVKEFTWSAKEVGGDVWFDMHLESADYYAERDIEHDDEMDYPSGWAAPIVWGNYHSCTMSSNYWHDGGFRICPKTKYTPDFLDGLEVEVDPNPEGIEEWDDLAFHIYLLGHDAVAKHRIMFERIGASTRFKIIWSGMIAQAYVGDYEFEHRFSVIVSTAEFPELKEKEA